MYLIPKILAGSWSHLEMQANSGRLHVFSDIDYAGDPVSRRNVSGFILYVLGVLESL